MQELVRERLTAWGARIGFGVVLLICSEWIVWQTPGEYSAPRWIALALLYVALAAITLDLIARLNVHELFSLLLVAGLYGLLNGALVSHITGRDLPFSLIVRPLGAQPLAFVLALAAFRILASERATGPLEFGAALGIGLVWGVWVRWFPRWSDDPIPQAEIGPALAALAVAFVVCLLIRYAVPPVGIYRRDDWLLTPIEWALAGGVLVAALVVGSSQGDISGAAVGITVVLGAYVVMMLVITRVMRQESSYLAAITPPRRPNPAAWLILLIPLLLAGWIGFSLPGGDDSSVQSDLLFAALTAFGIVWLPAVSIVVGVRSFVQLTREGM